ncbi:MAG: hypothetical protein KGH49_02215 [Candidatus Micrarchaeota archaeon]|nr:hypothetical protein [Candidatus Micrarchaeota archaeon]
MQREYRILNVNELGGNKLIEAAKQTAGHIASLSKIISDNKPRLEELRSKNFGARGGEEYDFKDLMREDIERWNRRDIEELENVSLRTHELLKGAKKQLDKEVYAAYRTTDQGRHSFSDYKTVRNYAIVFGSLLATATAVIIEGRVNLAANPVTTSSVTGLAFEILLGAGTAVTGALARAERRYFREGVKELMHYLTTGAG